MDRVMKHKPGDTLYCVFSQFERKNPSEVEITKVGRKWLTLSNGYRADIDTLVLDGGDYASTGKCWESEEAYRQYTAMEKVWEKIYRAVYYNRHRPGNVTMGDMVEICRLLRIDGYV